MGKASRAAFGEALLRIGGTHDRVVVLDADLASSVQTAKFGGAFPDRFFQMGIAEGNMIGDIEVFAIINLQLNDPMCCEVKANFFWLFVFSGHREFRKYVSVPVQDSYDRMPFGSD